MMGVSLGKQNNQTTQSTTNARNLTTFSLVPGVHGDED